MHQMGNVTAYLFARFKAWEKSSQIAFILAIVLLIPTLIITAAGPPDLRQSATIGTMGLIITAQVIFMWANRNMVTPYTRAQRLYLNGDFEGARAILEDLRTSDQADAHALTLLGNTYRQLGRLEESVSVLYEAVNNKPNLYFPLYGFGRTLLVQGHYADAADAIESAIELGAQPVVGFDAGEAHYRQGELQHAATLLQAALPHLQDEPHRTLMAMYLLYRLNAGEQPPETLIDAGISYWQAQAQLFAHTPYGVALEEDIRAMLSLTKET